jgi:hypothetical protein
LRVKRLCPASPRKGICPAFPRNMPCISSRRLGLASLWKDHALRLHKLQREIKTIWANLLGCHWPDRKLAKSAEKSKQSAEAITGSVRQQVS